MLPISYPLENYCAGRAYFSVVYKIIEVFFISTILSLSIITYLPFLLRTKTYYAASPETWLSSPHTPLP